MNTPSNVTWYKDAIIYEVHVRAFFDSTADGIGDFGGLAQKLDYLEDLGVTAIWLLPFSPSPLRDDGYDTANYTDAHPSYGTLKDFQRFLREAHRRGLRVITELVVNHTSDQHAWFQRSRRALPGSRWRNYYVWSDTPEKYRDARIIFKDFESSNWSWDPVAKAYYWHRFYSHQPDLNWDNPEVRYAMFAAMDFWLDLGAPTPQRDELVEVLILHGDGFLAGVPVVGNAVGTAEGVECCRWRARHSRSSGSGDGHHAADQNADAGYPGACERKEIGRASCRERGENS